MDLDSPAFAQAHAPQLGQHTGCGGHAVQIALFLAVILIAFAGQLWAWAGVVFGADVDAAAATAVQAAITLVLLLPFAWGWRSVREPRYVPHVAGGRVLSLAAGGDAHAAAYRGPIPSICCSLA